MTVDTIEAERITAHLAAMQPTHLQREIDRRRDLVNELSSNISQYSESIAGYMARARTEQSLIDAALAAMGESDWAAHLVSEFEQLIEHPRVADVLLGNSSCYNDASEQSIFVTTTPDLRLTRQDTGDSRWLGAFRIELNINRLQIRMANLNTRRGGRDHPHITDGMPCFGGHSTSFMQLLANGDLYVLFELLIQYLETLNLTDEYGRYGSFWFEVTDEALGMPALEAVAA